LAVQQNGFSIQHIEFPSKEVQILAVKQNGYAIYYVKQPSDEIKLLASLFRSDINIIHVDLFN
jgi:hypothetical protein